MTDIVRYNDETREETADKNDQGKSSKVPLLASAAAIMGLISAFSQEVMAQTPSISCHDAKEKHGAFRMFPDRQDADDGLEKCSDKREKTYAEDVIKSIIKKIGGPYGLPDPRNYNGAECLVSKSVMGKINGGNWKITAEKVRPVGANAVQWPANTPYTVCMNAGAIEFWRIILEQQMPPHNVRTIYYRFNRPHKDILINTGKKPTFDDAFINEKQRTKLDPSDPDYTTFPNPNLVVHKKMNFPHLIQWLRYVDEAVTPPPPVNPAAARANNIRKFGGK